MQRMQWMPWTGTDWTGVRCGSQWQSTLDPEEPRAVTAEIATREADRGHRDVDVRNLPDVDQEADLGTSVLVTDVIEVNRAKTGAISQASATGGTDLETPIGRIGEARHLATNVTMMTRTAPIEIEVVHEVATTPEVDRGAGQETAVPVPVAVVEQRRADTTAPTPAIIRTQNRTMEMGTIEGRGPLLERGVRTDHVRGQGHTPPRRNIMMISSAPPTHPSYHLHTNM